MLIRLILRRVSTHKPLVALPSQKMHPHSLTQGKIQQNLKHVKQIQKESVEIPNLPLSLLRDSKWLTPAYKSGNYQLIASLPDLIQASEHLQRCSVIGVDIEYHTQHSYDGFVCLVQISSYSQQECPQTFIFDVLQDDIKS